MAFSDIAGTTKVRPWSSTRGMICIQTQKVHTDYVTKSLSPDNDRKDDRAPTLTSTLALLIHQIRAHTAGQVNWSQYLFVSRQK